MENRRCTLSTQLIKETAYDLGFFACGIAKADRISTEAETRFRQWLSQGGHADMAYMENYVEQRLDPRLLMEGAKSIVCVALKTGLFNIGAPGQYLMGTMASLMVALSLPTEKMG